jgi:hypothetical protein
MTRIVFAVNELEKTLSDIAFDIEEAQAQRAGMKRAGLDITTINRRITDLYARRRRILRLIKREAKMKTDAVPS